VAIALGSPVALAQQSGGSQFVFMTDGAWGAAQDDAIRSAGGVVDFSHAGSGIGVASSARTGFLSRAMKSGAFSRGAKDLMVQWQRPTDVQVGDQSLVEDVVTPGNDNFINLLWNMTAINAYGAWSLGYDGAGARVAVIDGGMCSLHPDVAPNIDIAASASFVPGSNWYEDTGGATSFRHACHVAGIIAAADNTIGTIGVAPNATIIAVKALHGGSGSFAAVIQAILYAADPTASGGAGAHIINMSLGATFAKGGGNTGAGPLVAAMNQAVNYATANNVLVVTSAGNNAIDMDHAGSVTNVPAQSGSGIAISATAPVGFAVGWPSGATNFDNPTTYTNYGRSLVWVSAPGGDSALPGNAVCSIPRVVGAPVNQFCWVFDLVFSPGSQSGSYFWAGGTSMAAPHVSGVAALLVQKYPGISVGDLKNLIKNSAVDAGQNGTDPFHGHGFLNAYNAVTQ
jgi:subtilisin family serine protease